MCAILQRSALAISFVSRFAARVQHDYYMKEPYLAIYSFIINQIVFSLHKRPSYDEPVS